MSIPALERQLNGAKLLANAAANQLQKCRERRARAEGKLSEAGVSTMASHLAEWLAEETVMSRIEPGLVAELKRAERVVTDSETALEQARSRLVELERAAEVPAKIAAAQSELAALRGA